MKFDLLFTQPHNAHYVKKYLSFIAKFSQNLSEDYQEKHHVLPRCMFPEYSDLKVNEWNSVMLSGRAHYIAHWMLAKAFPTSPIVHAFWFMSITPKSSKREMKSTARVYEIAKKLHAKTISEDTVRAAKISKAHKGRVFTEEWKQKLSVAAINRVHSEESKITRKETWAAKTDEVKEAHSNLHSRLVNERNSKLTKAETKAKYGDSQKGSVRVLRLVTCPHCETSGKGGNMTRYHFDNCTSRKSPEGHLLSDSA